MSRPVCPVHGWIGHSAELPCYWCSVEAGIGNSQSGAIDHNSGGSES